MEETEVLQDISLLMSDPHATAEQIGKAGIQVFHVQWQAKGFFEWFEVCQIHGDCDIRQDITRSSEAPDPAH